MAIGPIHWGSYSGEQVEQVMAVLLLQERPKAWHRKPSRGDGGVDVVEPVDGGYHVYQIKKFVDELESSDRAKIKHSLETVTSDPRLDKPVTHWSLVIPRDQTSGDEEWFRGITAEAGFESDWLGETFWHSEAAKYPYVIDYFLQDGKERLNAKVQTLLQLLRDPDSPVRPVDVARSLGELFHELNATDPHYRYDVQVTGSPPAPRNEARLVMTSTRQVGIDTFVTVGVIPRYEQALADRPIGGSMTFKVFDPEAGIDLREAFQAHIDYGRPFEVPAEAVSVATLNAPGGLAEGLGEFDTTQIRIGPRSPINPEPLWLDADVFETEDGPVVANGLFTVTEQHIGQRAVEAIGVDPTGLLKFECRIHTPALDQGIVQFQIGIGDIVGLPISKVLAPYRFLLYLHPPNMLPRCNPRSVRTSGRWRDHTHRVTSDELGGISRVHHALG